jgi:prepilin-type N-terminal cleavage/methylation domain-containing protein
MRQRLCHDAIRGGFSLIEVLIAMLILSVGAASILALFAAAASTHRRSVDRTHAALVAERVISEARAAYDFGKTAEEVLAELKTRVPEEIEGYRHDIYLVHPDGPEWAETELFARVTVRWRESGQERSESFNTVLLPKYHPGLGKE